jgi:hypothetical protein
MPFLSKAQQRWGHSPAGVKALGGKDKVAEWDSATNFGKLPDKVKAPHMDKGHKNVQNKSTHGEKLRHG